MRIFCIIACLFLASCGDDNGNGSSAGSCSSLTGCTDYVGSMWTAQTAGENCSQIPDSTYSSSACPSADLVGSCSVNQGGPGEFIMRYYSPTFDAASAESICTNMQGTWIP